MTVFNIAKLPLASFDGVEFHYQEGTIDGGRKTVTHEYPNKKERYVEDLGGLERKFTITAWTDDNVSDSVRNNLLKALENEGGIKTFIHPRFGEQKVVVIGYTLNDNINQLGISKFTINLETASLNLFPGADKANKGFLANLKSKVLGQNEAAFDAGWASVKNNKAKFDSAVATTQKAARSLQRSSQLVQGIGDSFGDAATSINQLVNGASALVQAPSNLATNLRTAFDNLGVAYNSSKDLFSVMKGLFGFDERDQDALGNSQRQRDIRNNQNQLNYFINASVMASAYDAAANIDFTTQDELNQVSADLESGFEQLPDGLNRDIYDLLIEMRIQATNILSQQLIGLPKVVNYNIINPTSLNTFVYTIYGSLFLKEIIRNLNNFRDTSKISGNIKILTNV